MPLGTEVGLGLRNMVFDVDPATPRKKAHPPHLIFGPCLLWPNGWMDEDAAWYGGRPRSRPHVLDGVPAPAKGAQQPPLFRPMSIVATVAHLSYCWALVTFLVPAYPGCPRVEAIKEVFSLAFSALTLLVGRQVEHSVCKNWLIRYWHGYLSGARWKWFAYGPADATATRSSHALLKSRIGLTFLVPP